MTPLPLLLLHLLFSSPAWADPQQSVADCDLKICNQKAGLMCLCQKVALSSVGQAGLGWTSTNAGHDNFPFPGYLRTQYGNDLQRQPSSTVCHAMITAHSIDPSCMVSCSIMEQYIRAASGQDAMVCEKAVEEASIVMDGNILEDGSTPHRTM